MVGMAKKNTRGCPQERLYPPRIDLCPEEIARRMLASPSAHPAPKDYTCAECGRSVYYPETLYKGGTSADC